MASNPQGLNESELEFLEASAAARDAEVAERQRRYDDQLRSNRRLRRLLVGVGAFAVVALVAGLLALQQRQRANDAAAQAEFDRLVTLASALPEQDLQLANLAAVEAFDMRDGPESIGVLQQAMMTEPRFAGRIPGLGAGGGATRGPDGEWLFVSQVVPGEEASSGIWYDATTLESIGSVKVEDRWRLQSSPARTLVAATWLLPPREAAGDDRLTQVRLYDPQGREVATLDTTGRPTAVRFIDDDHLAVSDAAGLTIWDVRTLEVRQHIKDPDAALLESIEIGADASLLLVSSMQDDDVLSGVAMLVDIDEGIVVPGTVSPCEELCPIRFAPSGELVAIAGDGGVVLRDVASWDVVATIVAPDDRIESLDFSEDGATLYVGTFEGDLAFYDARTGDRSAPSIDTRAPGATSEVMMAPADHIITISSPGVIQRWSVDRAGPFGTWLESGAGIGVFSPDGSRFVHANDPRPGWITVYEPASGDALEAIELDETRPLGDIDFSTDGQRLAVSKQHGDVVIYDSETLEPTGWVLPDQGVAFLEFSPDGDRLAVGANAMTDYAGYLSPPTAPFAAHVWHIESGKVTPLELTVDFEAAGRPTWSPDGTKVALSDLFGGDAVFDAATGRQVGSRFSVRGQGQAHDVMWEPDGRSLLGVGAPGISRWDVATGERTSPFTEATPADWMDLADDGRLLVTASREGEARLWDLVAEVPVGVAFPDPGLGRLYEDILAPLPALSLSLIHI
mgnify:FL=1